MTATRTFSAEVEPLTTSAGFAVLAGFLSTVDPYFTGLALVLAAFTASLWVARVVPAGGGRGSLRRNPTLAAGVGLLLVTWGSVLGEARWIAGWAGLCLGASSGLLWWAARRLPPGSR
ncbi:MAG: hypothetical protein L3K19_02940 [Thermoplasmata archaeon]|nr:hypothetical protein [Thermoplasmata archaeon]